MGNGREVLQVDLLDSRQYRSSLERVCSGMDLSFLQGKTLLITGASGMLGSCLTDLLGVWNEQQALPCQIAAVSRDPEVAKGRFKRFWTKSWFSFHAQDVCAPLSALPETVDCIIHAASNADPVNMAKYPVDTLMANVLGAKNLLDYGRAHGMERFLFVSSGEVYGQPNGDMGDFTEDYCGGLDLSNPRSCYPEGKRAAEVLCQSYISQYGVDAVIVRPCHLFGPTMTGHDSRAVSEFLRNAVDRRDIVMKSDGLLERSHCYVVDAAGALLLVLRDGRCGEAYNIADKRYQMRIREFAEKAADAGGRQIVFEGPNALERAGYSKATRMVLDSAKLEDLGWVANDDTPAGIRETMDILRQTEDA